MQRNAAVTISFGMMRILAAVLVMTIMLSGGRDAGAQIIPQIPPAPSVMLPPPPPPPPPPKIEPVVPRMDQPLPAPKANLQQRGAFSDRVTRCLDEAAALGLGPNERAEYSRGCANQ